MEILQHWPKVFIGIIILLWALDAYLTLPDYTTKGKNRSKATLYMFAFLSLFIFALHAGGFW